MSLSNLAQQLAARGRSGDSMLVHMTPGEVGGLQAIAMAHGGSLTTNPDTGLPEANFLKAILPMLAGGALTALSGGALSPLMAAGIVGGGTALASKNLGQGLMAGLGAFGGAGLGGALAGLGSSAAGAGAELAGSAISAPGAGIATTGPGSQAAMLAAQNEGFGRAGLQSLAQAAGGTAPSAGATMGAGLTAAMQNPQALVAQLGGNKAALQTAGMAAAPALMGMGQGEMQGDSEENPHPMLAPASYGYAPRPRPSDVPSSRLRFAEGGIASLESNPYYTMSGDSADAFKYLMGQRSTGRSAQEIEAAAIPRPTTVTGPQYQGLPQFTLDTLTRQFTPTTPQDSSPLDAPAPRAGDRMFSLQELDTGGAGGGDGFAGGGRLLAGPGDGVSDSISATIDNRVPAKLATGEFVFDARTVSEIGNGDTKAGAKKLFAVMNAIHKKRASAQRGKPSGADRELARLA